LLKQNKRKNKTLFKDVKLAALTNCKECGNQVSKSAKTCPKCGAKLKMGFFQKVGVILLLFVLLAFVFAKEDTNKPSAKKAEDEKPSPRMAIAECQVIWESTRKNLLNDPSSFDWDRRSSGFGDYTVNGKTVDVVAIPYRAKNGFGALVLQNAICQIDKESYNILRVIK
jgi:predicted nucleic acid-binding Zn ribbon protein